MRNSWRDAWWAWLFRPAGDKFSLAFAYYILGVPASLLLTFGCWIWWRADVALADGVAMAFASLLGHLALTYETGYKKTFRDGQRQYFYIVWLIPMLLSVIGFIGGLFYRGILS